MIKRNWEQVKEEKMFIQNDSKWIIYALGGAVLLGILINDKMNSVMAPLTRPIIQVAPAHYTAEPATMYLPDAPTPKPASPSVGTPLPTATAPVAPTLTLASPLRTAIAPVASTPLTQNITHAVRPGDTLYSIARRYGTTVEAMMAVNGLKSYTIYVGQQLTIPR